VLLSDGDTKILSRLTNELSELIYAESEPLREVKGYRAIFSNMLYAQPLADGVLARLAQRNASATSTNAGSGTPPTTSTI
jgi:hypothetical protein